MGERFGQFRKKSFEKCAFLCFVFIHSVRRCPNTALTLYSGTKRASPGTRRRESFRKCHFSCLNACSCLLYGRTKPVRVGTKPVRTEKLGPSDFSSMPQSCSPAAPFQHLSRRQFSSGQGGGLPSEMDFLLGKWAVDYKGVAAGLTTNGHQSTPIRLGN